MKNWNVRLPSGSWALLAICGLFAAGTWVWTHGPDGVTPSEYAEELRAERYDAAYEARLEIIHERRSIGYQIEFDNWVRDVVPAVVADYRAGQALSIGWPADSKLKVAERSVIDERLAHPRMTRVTDREIAIGLHAVRSSMPSGIPTTRTNRAVMGTYDGTDYCVSVTSFAEDFMERTFFPRYANVSYYRGGRHRGARPSVLEGCTFAHLYGLPGPSIRGWLDQTGIPFPRDPGYTWASAIDLPIEEGFDVRGILLGGGFGPSGTLSRRVCAAGATAECMREFDPQGAGFQAAEGPSIIGSANSIILSSMQGDVLSNLEQEFGERAFLAFWTSELSFEQAFQEAFRMSPAEWTQKEIVELTGPVRAGPLPGGGSTVMTSLLVMIGVLMGVFFSGRRTV